MAKRKGASTADIDTILSMKSKSIKRTGIRRTYNDDPDSISNKWADYTEETINKLISDGEEFDKKAIVRIIPPDLEII